MEAFNELEPKNYKGSIFLFRVKVGRRRSVRNFLSGPLKAFQWDWTNHWWEELVKLKDKAVVVKGEPTLSSFISMTAAQVWMRNILLSNLISNS